MRHSPVERGSTRHHAVRLYEGDEKLLKVIQDELGMGKGEAIRTAIRMCAGILVANKK